jgi:hypothetical protein
MAMIIDKWWLIVSSAGDLLAESSIGPTLGRLRPPPNLSRSGRRLIRIKVLGYNGLGPRSTSPFGIKAHD